MGKSINIGMISDKINGITVNTSKPCSSGNFTNAASRSIEYIVMHYTGNKKDTAWANSNYFQTAGREASAHFFIDDTEIYQSVELRDKAWHCGTTGTYYHSKCRNDNSIGIEMCCTAGNYKVSETTKKNAAHACAYLCRLLGITAAEVDAYVLRHYDVTHKSCPAQMAGANNSEWTSFKDMVRNILKNSTGGTAEKPVNSGAVLYFVQTGAYAVKANAEAQAKKMKVKGFESIIKKSGNLYRVQTGAYSKKANAEAQAKQLRAKGFDAIVTTNGGTVVSASSDKIGEGDSVKVKQGAKTYTGGGLAPFVYTRTHTVTEINGDRAVIAYNGDTVAAVKLSDLTKA